VETKIEVCEAATGDDTQIEYNVVRLLPVVQSGWLVSAVCVKEER